MSSVPEVKMMSERHSQDMHPPVAPLAMPEQMIERPRRPFRLAVLLSAFLSPAS
ncbi:hypothetical protein [Zhengella mangrovi]|uniref:hypothetical protein n=1 Tax=Zhengella mangrovi TaxID=1982044 RepID=UPI0013FDAC3E|nr:hypothetical protein [Zhengella mangrovi]